MEQACVVYDFVADYDDALTVTTGEILTVLDQAVGEGWWSVSNSHGNVGLVPASYCELIDAQVASADANSGAPSSFTNPNYSTNWDSAYQSPPAPVAVTGAATAWPSSGAWGSSNEPHPATATATTTGWDDDDSDDDDWDSVSTAPNQSATNEPNAVAVPTAVKREKTNSSKEAASRGTSTLRLNRVSGFLKQGPDTILFLPLKGKVSDSDITTVIVDSPNGVVWQSPSSLFTCTMKNPKKANKFHGMKSFIEYQLAVSFTSILTCRRYKHFDWLQERLLAKFSTISVPPLPDKQISGRFEDEFINDRMRLLQLWLDRLCKHPVISQSDVFTHFLTCTDEKQWKVGKRVSEKDEYQGGKFFLTVRVPQRVLVQKEVEAQLDKFGGFVRNMDESIRNFLSIGEHNAKTHEKNFRKEYKKIGSSFSALSKSLDLDDKTPESQKLKTALLHTGKTYEEIGDLFGEQPRKDMQPLLEGVQEYKRILGTMPDILEVEKAVAARLQDTSIRATDEERKEAERRANVMSYCIMAEVNHYRQHQVVDLKAYGQNYLRAQIDFFKTVTQRLEQSLAQYS